MRRTQAQQVGPTTTLDATPCRVCGVLGCTIVALLNANDSRAIERADCVALENRAHRMARLDDVGPVAEFVSDIVTEFRRALTLPHDGDCVCQPQSCFKCLAEEALGIDTIEGLGKHEGALMASTFAVFDHPRDVMRSLRNPDFTRTGGFQETSDLRWDDLVRRWTRDSTAAAEWLDEYTREHFP